MGLVKSSLGAFWEIVATTAPPPLGGAREVASAASRPIGTLRSLTLISEKEFSYSGCYEQRMLVKVPQKTSESVNQQGA